MVSVWPFRALRPARTFAGDVASQAYDVVDRDEAVAIARVRAHSFLRVEKSEINLPADVDSRDPRVYQSARDVLDGMIQSNVMIRDPEPRWYVYRQERESHSQSGIVGCVDVEEYRSGRIKRHELTRSDKELDRTDHVNRVNAHTGPVFLACHDDGGDVDAIVKEIVSAADPEYDFRADDGTRHTVWVVADREKGRRIAGVLGTMDALYIADGHHRAAAAVRVADMRRAADPGHGKDREYNRMLSVIFPRRHLRILPYNRVVRDLAGMTERAFHTAVSRQFTIEPSETAVDPPRRGMFGMYLAGRWHGMTPKSGEHQGSDPVSDLDVSILQDRLIGPILGVDDVRRDERIDFVGGIRGTAELERLVDSGRFAVGFSLYPTDMATLIAVSDAGLIMPPKSTWFEPKLLSGLFVHLLDDPS